MTLATLSVPALRRRLRVRSVAGPLADAAGWTVGRALASLPMLPPLAGAAMVSLGAAMVYLPAGVIAGGVFLLWIGTELNRAP